MRRLLTLLALVLSASMAWAQPSFSVTVTHDTFDDRLSPYGSWFDLPGHGRVWQPAYDFVGDDFYPYGSGGQWVLTDEGWVFDSDYPFGWAVFHYGRWMLDPDYGWVWVPGNTWAPAWVSWRTGGSYVGWAPMGPRGVPEFQRDHWLFVETGQLTVRNVRTHAVDERRFHAAVTITQPVHGAVPIGPPPSYVTAASRVQIRAVPVRDVRGGRAIPPPPPPGRAPPPPARRIGAPPPPRGGDSERIRGPGFTQPVPPPPGRVEPQRAPPPPPGRVEPQRAPPPGRVEPQRAPPPGRVEPQRAPPPGRIEPQRAPPPGRMEPQRNYAPPPPPGQPAPSTTKPRYPQQGPPGPAAPPRRGPAGPPPPPGRR